jgi:phosphate transport system permease protein
VSEPKVDICGSRSKVREHLFHVCCWLAILLPLTMLVVLVADVAIDGIERLDWAFIKGFPSRRAHRAGIWPALSGTLWLVGLTGLLAIPTGVGAAVYLEEYGGNRRLANFIELNIANLAGVPSVIYGLLGLELFVRVLGFGSSVLAGGCTLALLVLPIVIIASREALRTVPYGLREAALGLGCTPWQMIRRVVLPMALPGILTGAILSVSRAIGETAPLILVGAVVFITFTPEGLDSQFTALPIQIYNWVSMPQKGFMENAAAGIVVLLATLLSINLVAILLRNRFQRRKY